MPGTLILLCGLPGAGKTTLAKRIESERGAVRLSPDDWIERIIHPEGGIPERDRLRDPVEDALWDLTLQLLRRGMVVVLDYGFWSEIERSLYALGALEVGAEIELYYLEAEHEELWRRIEERNSGEKVFAMTRFEVEEGWRLFEAPTEEEMRFYDDWGVMRAE